MTKTPGEKLPGRTALLVAGLLSVAAGVAIFTKVNLGYDPFMVFDSGISQLIGLSLGLTHLSINLMLLAVYLAIGKISYIGIGTILALTVTGPSIDAFTWMINLVIRAELSNTVRVLMAAASCVLVGLGVYLYTGVRLGAGPNDLLSVIVSDAVKRPLGPIRIAVDALWLTAGFLLGGKIGLGTLFSLLLVGVTVQLLYKAGLFSSYIRRNPPA